MQNSPDAQGDGKVSVTQWLKSVKNVALYNFTSEASFNKLKRDLVSSQLLNLVNMRHFWEIFAYCDAVALF